MRKSLLAIVLLAACKIEDGPPKPKIDPDTIGRFADSSTSPISDPSLRPMATGAEPATVVRGDPSAVADLMKGDTVHAITMVDSSPAAQPVPSDLTTLRLELSMPVAGVKATDLHDTYNEMRGGTRVHEALDILAPRGTPVLSATGGRVLKLFNSKAGGLMVYAADSSERFILMYGHLDAYAPGLADGQPLKRGQQIGIVGTTGNAPANTPHLHFALARSLDVKQWSKGVPVDPYPLLRP
ncbi:MAG: M23 family metallopeptidase [Gemmatimonadaceae bacterium]